MKDTLKEIERILDLLYEHIDDYTYMPVKEIEAIHDDLRDVYNAIELMSLHQKEQEGMSAEEWFDNEYGIEHIFTIMGLSDEKSMFSIMEQYAKTNKTK